MANAQPNKTIVFLLYQYTLTSHVIPSGFYSTIVILLLFLSIL